ncbi:MAG: NADP-dependent oxidoreductase [Pseudomonadota bacterium]
MSQATQVRLIARPEAEPTDDIWSITHDAPADPGPGEIAVDVQLLSIDPAMRGWIMDRRSYLPPVGLGEVMRAFGVGVVTASNADDFAVGDPVIGSVGTQTVYVGPTTGFRKIMPEIAPPEAFLSGLGVTGMTAYFGLLDVGALQEGETVLVSAAAGGVGSMVGQIAKIKNCKVIGIAGGAEKCAVAKDRYGFDACIDYKAENISARIKELCPERINVYFDNVGGECLEAALDNIAERGRIVVCGGISQYNLPPDQMTGPRNYLQIIANRARMEGFVIIDYMDRFQQAAMEMIGWRTAGKLVFDDHIVDGLENFPSVLRMLFKGENKGKLILRV